MSNKDTISLTASELGYLWTGYSINEMSMWYLKAFRDQAKDEEIKDLYTFALEGTKKILDGRKTLLSNEGYAIPIGFSEKDIHTDAGHLYSDRFLLYYLHVGVQVGLEFHARAAALSTRQDVRNYLKDCLESSTQLSDKVTTLSLNKGLYWRTPTLPAPTHPEHIQKESYLNGWIGDVRPLNSMELANLYEIIELLIMIETLCIGFAQTSDCEEVAQICKKAADITKKLFGDLVGFLKEESLPTPPSYSAEMTDSKGKLFSDQIMITHVAGLFGSLLSQYGFSLGSVMKHDLLTAYTTHISRAGAFSEKVTRFMIDKEWLEKVPGVINREKL
ncbi:DUF3231 family protein [Cytobacillus suaedae]|nr:DUF3231 family protein [Cytobacillus suaedae]